MTIPDKEDAPPSPAMPAQSDDAENHIHRRQANRGRSIRDYLPLVVLLILTMASATAKQAGSTGSWNRQLWMHDFMGLFLIVLSMFKLFDLPAFADGFQMYDLLAKPFRTYAYIYPFLELGLGLGYLSCFNPVLVYSCTAGLMIFGSFGVLKALIRKLDLECACMGNILKVPLSTVALIEDLGMAAMVLAMLWIH